MRGAPATRCATGRRWRNFCCRSKWRTSTPSRALSRRIGGETGFDSGTAAHAMLLAASPAARRRAGDGAACALRGVYELPDFRVGLGMEAMLPPAQPAPATVTSAPHTIRMTGSHDLSLTLLGDWLHAEHPGLRMTGAANVGSLSGLTALMQHEAHLAGSHLLDEETGEFNIGPVRRLMAPRSARRDPGLRRAGSGDFGAARQSQTDRQPGILGRDDVLFVNRQRGSGTRDFAGSPTAACAGRRAADHPRL